MLHQCLLAVLSLTPLALVAQDAVASRIAEPMPLRAMAVLDGVRTVHDLHEMPRGGFVALVRIADHSGMVWLDAALRETRRVEFRGVRSGEMLRMVAVPSGGFLAAVETASGARTVTGLRLIDAQGALQRLVPLAGPVSALHALPGGDVLVAVFLLQPDGDGVTQLLRLAPDGTQRWQLRVPRAQVARLTASADAYFAAVDDPLAERGARVIGGSLDGRLLWERELPWDAAATATVEAVLGPDASGTRAAGASRARHGVVSLAADALVVFAAGGQSFERFVPLRYRLTLAGEVADGPVITPVREGWSTGRMPYSGWAPSAFPTGGCLEADGSYTFALQYQDADGEGYVAVARTRADGTTQWLRWALSRDPLIATSAGWILVQAGREATRIGLMEDVP